jgi:dTDP-4-amino-4,6-dideoxygalactose transaminase
LDVVHALNKSDIFQEDIFSSLNTLPYLKESQVPISEDISKRILCLPLYAGLNKLSS